MPVTTLGLALLQMDTVSGNREANYETVRRFSRQAAAEGADVLILPEMFATGFSPDVALSESADGPTMRFLREVSAEHRIHVIAGVLLSGSERPRNTAVVLSRDGDVISRYVKTHLFAPANEHEVMMPGEGPVVFTLDGFRLSVFICFDLRFPEDYRRVAEEVDALVTIAAWPAARQDHWDLLLQARAVENQCWSVGVNRVGSAHGNVYDGGSAVIAPSGDIRCRVRQTEGLLQTRIDAAAVAEIRSAFPVLCETVRR